LIHSLKEREGEIVIDASL